MRKNLLRVPHTFSATDLERWPAYALVQKVWVPSRPEGLTGLFPWKRLRSAFMVFIGKADVLTWPGQ